MRRRASNPSKFDRCVTAVKKRGGAVSPYAVCSKTRGNPAYSVGDIVLHGHSKIRARVVDFLPNGRVLIEYVASGKQYTAARSSLHVMSERKRRFFQERGMENPAAAAAEGYRDFHGEDPGEDVTVKKTRHYHKHLSGAGELRGLFGRPLGGGKFSITKMKGALLAFNEARNQLFIEGGDQSIDLEEWGIDSPHELETLGKLTKIDYHTTKRHLGPKEGGTAVYRHKFATVNEDGRIVRVKILRYPDLIYRVLDEQLEFSGGSYEILPEGIDK